MKNVKCHCGWKLPQEGMRFQGESRAAIPTDLHGLVIFACPDCGAEWEAPMIITHVGSPDLPKSELS